MWYNDAAWGARPEPGRPFVTHHMTTSDDSSGDWQKTWDAREVALKSVLGETDSKVFHAVVPFHLGGNADVLCFREHIPGRVLATCELLGEECQIQNELGTYELAIAQLDENDWAPNVISRLARYTCDALLEPGHTMDISSAVPKASTVAAFLFCEYARFDFHGRDAGLLLCLGITSDELRLYHAGDRKKVVAALKSARVYPYTDLYRDSVLRKSCSGT